MINQFYFALKDIMKNRWLVITFIFQLSIAFLYISLITDELISDWINQKQFNETYGDQFISFKYYENQNKSLKIGGKLDKLLDNTLDGNPNGYSTVITNVMQSNMNPNADAKVLVGLGGFGKLFDIAANDKEFNKLGITVLLGSKVRGYDVGDNISVGTFSLKSLTIDDHLSPGTSYVDDTGIHNLDDSILILTTWNAWNSYNKVDYVEQVLGNLKLLNVYEDTANEFAQSISRANEKYDLVPVSLNDINGYKMDDVGGKSSFLFFLIGVIMMICIGATTSLIQLVNNNFKEYSIHRVYGAQIKEIYTRTIIYSIIIITTPLLVVYFYLRCVLPGILSFMPMIFISISIIMIIAVTLNPILKLRKQDMTMFLRSDVK